MAKQDDQKKKLEALHREALEKFEEYMKAKAEIGKEHHEKVHEAKNKWQKSWAELMDVLMVLERIEI
jgi:hypothetical protein